MSFSKTFEKLERVFIGLQLVFSVASTFLKTGVISAYFKISGKLPLYTVCEYVRVNIEQVHHDFHWNVFECTDFVFWQLLNCFYDFSFFNRNMPEGEGGWVGWGVVSI